MKKKVVLTIIIISILIVILASVFFLIKKDSVKTDYKKMKLDGNEKLMIVAHPDDEILWGGSRLIEDDYVVVCITCGKVPKRVKEFQSVMEKTGDKYIMLDYPDKVAGKRSDWKEYYDDITKDIENIYKLKDWDEIVTHNPDGEYGHIHHVMTNKIVTDVVDKENLIYFGKYYSKNKMEELATKPPRIDEDILEKKIEILKMYESQDFIFDMFPQMFPHEDYKTYDEWQAIIDEENR